MTLYLSEVFFYTLVLANFILELSGRTSKGFTKHFHKLENLAAKKLLEKNVFTQQHTTKNCLNIIRQFIGYPFSW